MDSASKAIIIAGGILIGVLVISISMAMLTSFREIYTDSMDAFDMQEITRFNSFFVQYGNGSTIKGYDVYNIIGKINEVKNNPDEPYFVYFSDNITKNDFYYTENFLNEYIYTYEFDTDGVVSKIVITPKDA